MTNYALKQRKILSDLSTVTFNGVLTLLSLNSIITSLFN